MQSPAHVLHRPSTEQLEDSAFIDKFKLSSLLQKLRPSLAQACQRVCHHAMLASMASSECWEGTQVLGSEAKRTVAYAPHVEWPSP